MQLHDALFNWLQIRIVAEGRPDDNAARETLDFFAQILAEDHHCRNVRVVQDSGGSTIAIHYEREGAEHVAKFPRESAEQLLADINANPKYNE